MEKGHSVVILKFQQFQELKIEYLGNSGSRLGSWCCSALWCTGLLGIGWSPTAHGNWVSVCWSSGSLHRSQVIQRCFPSQYPTDRSLTPLSLSFTFLLVCGYQVKWYGLGIVSLTYPTKVSSTGYYQEREIILNLISKPHLKKDNLLLPP